jgi:putative DNA primase/helicase
MVTDMHASRTEVFSAAANQINRISGRDSVRCNRKHKDPWEGDLPIKIWLAGTFLPDFQAHAREITNRLLVASFDVSFAGREDKSLKDHLITTELDGIFLWALAGLDRLTKRGHFVEPPESTTIKTRMLRLANPVLGFVEDECEAGDFEISKQKLYDHYVRYCSAMGLDYPLTLNKFAERLYQILPGVTAKRLRDGPDRVQVFAGVKWKPPFAKPEDATNEWTADEIEARYASEDLEHMIAFGLFTEEQTAALKRSQRERLEEFTLH